MWTAGHQFPEAFDGLRRRRDGKKICRAQGQLSDSKSSAWYDEFGISHERDKYFNICLSFLMSWADSLGWVQNYLENVMEQSRGFTERTHELGHEFCFGVEITCCGLWKLKFVLGSAFSSSLNQAHFQ